MTFRHVEHCMGTVFTLLVCDPGEWDQARDDVVAWLRHVDALFSTYRPESEISRLRRGELVNEDADPLVREVLTLCDVFEEETDGWFTAHLPGGLDPTGLVKGWAIERASDLLRRHGSSNHAVNGGGDMQLAGEPEPGRPWNVGIADPHLPGRVLTTIRGADLAIATSGVAERGEHIVDPHRGAPARGLASVTVTGPSLTRADVWATAAFAMGTRAVERLAALPGHQGLVVHEDGTVARTAMLP